MSKNTMAALGAALKGKRTQTDEPKPAAKVARSASADHHALTVYVPLDLHRQVKARVTLDGRQLSELVEELLTDWLQKASRRAS